MLSCTDLQQMVNFSELGVKVCIKEKNEPYVAVAELSIKP